MSATGKTTNFKIPTFLPTDTTGWLNGFNPAMERIDTVLKEKENDIEKNKTDIALHEQTIETLNGKAGELTGEIDSANNEIAKINTVAVNAATAAKESNDKADNASSVATAANSAAESAISSANEAKDTADRALTESADAKSRAKSANDLAILNRGRLDTAESTIEGIGIQADAIESDLGTATANITELQNELIPIKNDFPQTKMNATDALTQANNNFTEISDIKSFLTSVSRQLNYTAEAVFLNASDEFVESSCRISS